MSLWFYISCRQTLNILTTPPTVVSFPVHRLSVMHSSINLCVWDLVVDGRFSYSWWDLAEWLERLTANAKVATTVLGSIPESSEESEERQMKQCWIKYWKNQKNLPLKENWNLWVWRIYGEHQKGPLIYLSMLQYTTTVPNDIYNCPVSECEHFM